MHWSKPGRTLLHESSTHSVKIQATIPRNAAQKPEVAEIMQIVTSEYSDLQGWKDTGEFKSALPLAAALAMKQKLRGT